MSGPRAKVLVVDDSAFARKVLRELIARAPELEVVGIARDGLEALEKIAELKPDVITLDLVMPNLDGLGVLAALPRPGPRAVVVSMAGEDSALAVAALQAGAVGLVRKPTALATDRLYELGDELIAAVRAAAIARQPQQIPDEPPLAPASLPAAFARPRTGPRVQFLALGASTGGPQALTRIVRELPADLPVAAAIVLHLPAGYTAAFAERLDRESALEVVEAREGLEFVPGRVVVARAGLHLKLERRDAAVVARLGISPADTPHRPSVDVLFESAAAVFGAGALGVILSGMGDDGLAGARLIHAAGGRLLTQSEDTCVVYGMPRAVVEAGLSSGAVAIERMARAIVELAR